MLSTARAPVTRISAATITSAMVMPSSARSNAGFRHFPMPIESGSSAHGWTARLRRWPFVRWGYPADRLRSCPLERQDGARLHLEPAVEAGLVIEELHAPSRG